jgi:hypothetical protein
MREGPKSASRSVGADFVSPWSLISLLKSLEFSQHMTTLIIVGTFLIELVTVFSTGLFELQHVTLDDAPTDLVSTANFDGSNFDSQMVDGTPVLTVAGVKMFNLSYPAGTSSQYAFQPFNVSGADSCMFTLFCIWPFLFSNILPRYRFRCSWVSRCALLGPRV